MRARQVVKKKKQQQGARTMKDGFLQDSCQKYESKKMNCSGGFVEGDDDLGKDE